MKSLLPDRYPNRDFFVADIFDAAPKDDMAGMEHPMFSLAKQPDMNIRRYEHNGDSIEIQPSHIGLEHGLREASDLSNGGRLSNAHQQIIVWSQLT